MASKSSSIVDPALNKVEKSNALPADPSTQQELKKVQQICHSLNEELHMLAYAISHDLEQPLRHIMAYAKLLARRIENQNDPEIQKFAEFIQTAGVTLDGRINAILAYSRLSQHTLRKQEVNTEEILKNICSRYKKELEIRNIELSLESLPIIETDPDLFKLIFTKLFENSLRFTSLEKNPQIKIQAIQKNGETSFTIEDNGVGMGDNKFDRMVQLFQQGDYDVELPEAPNSLGSGLAMVKRAVNMLEGSFSYSKTAQDKPQFHIRFY